MEKNLEEFEEENWIIERRKLKISSFKGQQCKNQYLLLIVQNHDHVINRYHLNSIIGFKFI